MKHNKNLVTVKDWYDNMFSSDVSDISYEEWQAIYFSIMGAFSEHITRRDLSQQLILHLKKMCDHSADQTISYYDDVKYLFPYHIHSLHRLYGANSGEYIKVINVLLDTDLLEKDFEGLSYSDSILKIQIAVGDKRGKVNG